MSKVDISLTIAIGKFLTQINKVKCVTIFTNDCT